MVVVVPLHLQASSCCIAHHNTTNTAPFLRIDCPACPIPRFAAPISRFSPPCSTLHQIPSSDQIATTNSGLSRVELRTLRDCRLGIARYPDFVYNGVGGGGFGTAQELEDGRLAVEFDIEKLYIPPLGFRTATFLGLPLPPFICIDVIPKCLKGFVERTNGKVELQFSAKFMFSIGSLYRAPPLLVDTLLTTEPTEGRLRQGQGRRLDSEGQCRLVGVAPLDPIEDAFMNAFLTLPTDCLANLAAKFTFSH